MGYRQTDTIGLALIARDEELALPRLLDSIYGCFDEVLLLDTGSTDATTAAFTEWAERERVAFPGFRGRLFHYEWHDDFAAARNMADALLDTSWRVWADADDEIRGAGALRRIAAATPHRVAGFTATYETGPAPCRTHRMRMVRRGAGRWINPVHEQLVVTGELAEIQPETVLWVHRSGPDGAGHPERNLQILRRWLEREPENRRALAHAGREEADLGNHEQAVDYFRRFDACSTGWDEERAQVRRQLALSLIALGQLDEAASDAETVAAALPDWPDSHLTLAEVALERGDARSAVSHAERVLALGPPSSPLLQVATDYTAHPRLLIARALSLGGDGAASRASAQEALAALAGSGRFTSDDG